MEKRYAQIKLCHKGDDWRLIEYTETFPALQGASGEGLCSSADFSQLLSMEDIPQLARLCAAQPGTLCPWVFSLGCPGAAQRQAVLLQLLEGPDSDGRLSLGVHEAGFLAELSNGLNQRLAALEKSVPVGLCQGLFDEDFTIIWHNSYFLDILGYSEEEFTQRLHCRASGYMAPGEHARVAAVVAAALAEQAKDVSFEMEVLCRDGRTRCLLTSVSLTGETVCGAPVFYSVGIDITDRQEAERLRAAMEQRSSYLLEYDVARRVLRASVGLDTLFCVQGDMEDAPQRLRESGLVMADSQESLTRLFQKIHSGESQAEELLHLRKREAEDCHLWLRLRLTSLTKKNGRAATAILLAEDITEQYEMQLRYREEETRRIAMSYSMNFSFQLDITHERVLTANEVKFPFFNFQKSHSLREFLHAIATRSVHPDDRAEYLVKVNPQYLAQQFGQGVPEISLEYRVAQEDGSYCWRRGILHIIREPSQGALHVYAYTREINEEKQKELQLRMHAERDALTGLLNRYTIERSIDQALETQPEDCPCVMYMLDLDNFKTLNDGYGHLQGDEMLRQTAAILRQGLGPSALAGRIGGDEMAAFLPNCVSQQEIELRAQSLCDAISQLPCGEGVVTISIGIAFFPQDGRSFAELYRRADAALYEAKRSGKNCWAVYCQSDQGALWKEARLPVSREWLLEESNDLVYVCDFYNYGLLYMNLGAKRMFGVEGDSYVGKKCYELLQGLSAPCPFCTNHLLCREEFYCWDFRNPTINKTFLLRDRVVDWYGTPARIEFATDISNIDHRAQALETQVKVDQLTISCLQLLSGSETLGAAIDQVLAQLGEFYQADRVSILEYDGEQNRLMPLYGWAVPAWVDSLWPSLEDALRPTAEMHRCLQEKSVYLLENAASLEGSEPENWKRLLELGIGRQQGVPYYCDGAPSGFLLLDNPKVFWEETATLETLSFFISEEMSRRQLSERLAFLCYHDSLTGLWNRTLYVQFLQEMDFENIPSLGVAVADLNGLKRVNKLRGHHQGDELVQRASALLEQSFPGAEIFRLSGDEFHVLSVGTERLDFLEQVQRARDGAPGLDAYGISLGYAWASGDIDPAKLSRQASEIMQMQKRAYYEQAEEQSPTYLATRQRELLEALRRGSFQMYLQPKADCKSQQLDGAEALVRYESAETGLVLPGRFIPRLEEEQLIRYVDLFIFEEVCKLLRRWQEEGRPLLPISLNFSRQTVLEPNVLGVILELTERYGVPKEFIEVEITETLGDYGKLTVSEIGAAIKAAGFRLALDDFGSQYTNMAMLATVEAHVLKLDRSLVQSALDSQASQLVLKSILTLCRELGISSVAEGVETAEQWELLRGMDCDSIQGYLFGRPTTVEEFEKSFLPA